MKILNITGPAGAGKSTALRALRDTRSKAIRTALVEVAKGGVIAARRRLVILLDASPQQVYLDIDGRASPAFVAFAARVCERCGVQYLAIAQSS